MSDFKCVLVHTPQLSKKQENNTLYSNINYCAMGLYSLASELEKEGFESEIIHLGVEKYLDKKFSLSNYTKENKIKFVAFSLHWHPQSYDVIETARALKENNPDVFIMLGGFTSSYFAFEILREFPFIDAIIKGEGELPMRMLARKVFENDNNLSDVPNISWRKNGKVVLNNKLYVATNEDLNTFDFFNLKKMKNHQHYARIPFLLDYSEENQLENQPMSSQGVCLGRGCKGNCTWCGGGCEAMKAVTGRDFVSYRDSNSVISEIKMLKEKCGIELFRFAFDPDPKYREHLITLLEKIAIEFNGEIKTAFTLNGLPDKQILDAYAKAFSKDSIMAISPEFFSEDLRKYHKSFYYSNDELENILEYMDKLEIKSELYFSILPQVDEHENSKSEAFAQNLKNKYKFVEKYYIIPIVYEPAAPWTITPERFGLDIKIKTFIDYYNDTKCVKKSFENSMAFLPKKICYA